jgi:hypothetical protein
VLRLRCHSLIFRAGRHIQGAWKIGLAELCGAHKMGLKIGADFRSTATAINSGDDILFQVIYKKWPL